MFSHRLKFTSDNTLCTVTLSPFVKTKLFAFLVHTCRVLDSEKVAPKGSKMDWISYHRLADASPYSPIMT